MLFNLFIFGLWANIVMATLMISFTQYDRVNGIINNDLEDLLYNIDDEPTRSSNSTLDSAVISAVTGSTILGAVIGGDIAGAVLGDMIDGDIWD